MSHLERATSYLARREEFKLKRLKRNGMDTRDNTRFLRETQLYDNHGRNNVAEVTLNEAIAIERDSKEVSKSG